MFIIEKNIPMPPNPRASFLTDVFRDMQIGDMVELPYRCKSYMYQRAKAAGIKVTRRREGGILKVWRIA